MSKKEFDELNDEEIFGEDSISEDDIEFDDEDFGEDEVLYEDENIDKEDEEYDYITEDDIPDYTVKSIFAILFCLPFGVMSLIYSNKTKEALRRDNLHDAIEASDKAGLFFKLGMFLTFVLVIGSIAFAMFGAIFLGEKVKEAETVVEKPIERVVPQWEISAKTIITLEKTFKAKYGKYRYYMSQEIADDEVLGYRYDEIKEKHHYMTEIVDGKLFLLIYEVGKTPDTGKKYRMDSEFNIDKYGFDEK